MRMRTDETGKYARKLATGAQAKPGRSCEHKPAFALVPPAPPKELLHQKAVTSVILGAKRVDQLSDTLASVDVTLAAEELKQLDEASKLPAEYPDWMTDIWSKARAEQHAAQRHPR